MDSNRDVLNSLLCDELLGEILGRLQEICCCNKVSLVCRRWLAVQRSVKTSLGLFIPEDTSILSFRSRVRDLLRQYSQVLNLSVVSASGQLQRDTVFLDDLLNSIGEGCKLLNTLRFEAGPVSSYGLQALAKGSVNLTSLELVGSSPKFFGSLVEFKSLRELTLVLFGWDSGEEFDRGISDVELPLEKLCLAGIRGGYTGLGWIWRCCSKLKKLELFSCEGIGDGDLNLSSFVKCLPYVEELCLRRSRTIANGVLLRAAENCKALRKLVFHDGGSTEGLHHVVIRQCRSLEVLDLRLPLDLSNEDLAVIANNCQLLKSLRLHSCCLPTGAGLKLLGLNMSLCLEELVLVGCQAVVREPGTLATLGQHLKGLKKLDLSENDHLPDKELGAMLSSCKSLTSLRLLRCRGLTDMVVVLIVKSCQVLETIDIRRCEGITAEAVFGLVSGSPKLRRLAVEEHKITEETKKLASRKKIATIKAETTDYRMATCGMNRFSNDLHNLDANASLL
ncbi:hypothetical protein SUGI_0416890 [Cryptomeria japonica]|uniref:F-box/LRR-repeat protein 4 n=1 Tax=Cryptomeria japonica TaxID=3369 RepID=UPI0024089A27|nr:F-box/LRR-repeat protein 4 [Cryptomeria japonica]GLJ22185.1 hypothetical protein SUGI_0416890 [Cryptomeria japonica]